MCKIYVCIKENSSDIHNVNSFVPQGSVLAPLFLLYVNDFCNVVKYSKILMFADDLTLYKVLNNFHDASLLQYDLHVISEWPKSWLVDINLSKCKVMNAGNPTSNYYINETLISVFTCKKNLGVFWM